MSAFRQSLEGASSYRCGRIHNCHFTVFVQKIKLAVASWSRGGFQGGSRMSQLKFHFSDRLWPQRLSGRKPRVSGNHMCHEVDCLLSQLLLQLHCSLRMLSAVVQSAELGARSKANVALFFHMTFRSALYHQCLRTTGVWYCTTRAVTHSKNLCVRMVVFVCHFLFQREASPSFLSHKLLQM